MNVTPFSLREKTEAPLIKIDGELKEFAFVEKAKTLDNYRDYPSRTIYWREWRTVRYIQIKLDESSSDYEKNIFYYNVYLCSYKIRIPFLWFWNMYFDVSKENCRELGKLRAPINFKQFISLLGTAGGTGKNCQCSKNRSGSEFLSDQIK